MSLSSWRAWIEIPGGGRRIQGVDSRSPHGERGLKCVWVAGLSEIWWGRSPHGERGLKSPVVEEPGHDEVALLMESVD